MAPQKWQLFLSKIIISSLNKCDAENESSATLQLLQMVSFRFQVSNGDLAEAVAFLTEKNAKVPQQDEATYYQTTQIGSDRYISVGSQADTSTYLHLQKKKASEMC